MSDTGCGVAKIAVADTLKDTLQAYVDWLKKVLIDADILIVSSLRRNLSELDTCDAAVLTGGSDIHPKFYGHEDYLSKVYDPNEARDEFEITMIRQALEKRLPVLGICRGMQMFNVAMGGTLIPDVRSAGYQNHSKRQGSTEETRHGIRIEPGTVLEWITSAAAGEVNSSHHQAVDRLGHDLRVTARSVDGVIEGAEWDQPEGKPFLQLVQWHPERMKDFENPLSRGLLQRFAEEVQVSRD